MAGYFPFIPAKCSLAKSNFRFLVWIAIGIVLFIMIVLGLVLGLVFVLAHKAHGDNVIGKTVTLDYSTFNGVDGDNGVTHWLGIRYAAPPVGDLRFRAPQDPLKNDTVQDASQVLPPSLIAQFFKLKNSSMGHYVASVPQTPLDQATLKTASF